ncbi:enoyl-CoA hydratase/carnithine racemase [Virgibacillus natechei]|uniref:Enoyl-CoA hydratase/carnithine racemase n=1 Tax=Virgibacillus natechei TaxID=1216297 RepID=A0ABS4IJW7_9BACI|nr:enoyl-CoA hydratase [Virgibacillus natechei]MBP1971260.1 enoyl-CoA hydratase/carnithine racemase [Virgibacillus natechei]UZD12112.1 enoyl-CoA hydratase [Virgibacillus natechei]
MSQLVTYKKENGIAIITIDNPPLNVLNQQIQKELKGITAEIKNDKEVVCVLLTSAGDKAFMAGADIKEFPEMMGNPDMRSEVMFMHGMLNDLDQLPKPTIAVLDGLTFGGGCELALSCDMRVAEEQTQLGFPEIKLGLFPGGAGTQRLPRLIGEAKAKEMMFTGEPIASDEAERIGLVNHVVPNGKAFDKAMNLALQIANKSLQPLSRIKNAVDEGLEMSLIEGIEKEADLFEEVFQTEDVKEGVEAFIEKRKPHFRHR